MDRRHFLLTCTGLLAASGTMASRAVPQIVFLNPAEPMDRGTSPFWRDVSRFMAAAARRLGMQLEILWAERDHLRMLHQCEDVANRAKAPDYVVIVNQKQLAPRMFKMLARSSAKVFLMHNDLSPVERHEIGNERERFANWIGTATPAVAGGSYSLMDYLYRRLGGRKAMVVGIGGDPEATITRERVRGVEEFLAGGRGSLLQMAYGDPTYADGEQKTSVLLARYPETNIVWAGDDAVALGALQAVKSRGAAVLVGGMGDSAGALASIAEGGLAASTVGLHMIGAWTVVMLHDYHRGKDFAANGGVNQKLDYLYVVHRDNVSRYGQAVFQRGTTLDFDTYSQALHPRPGPYDFRLEHLMHGSPKAK